MQHWEGWKQGPGLAAVEDTGKGATQRTEQGEPREESETCRRRLVEFGAGPSDEAGDRSGCFNMAGGQSEV